MIKKCRKLRVIAPSRSMVIISEDSINIANKYFNEKNIEVSFGNNIMKNDPDYNCSSIENRINDLHDAFIDDTIDYILTAIGGHNSNQLLPYIDYNLIKKNQKILCGYSDITALLNAIYAKTGMITYYGPHYSTFGMIKGNEYTKKYFEDLVLNQKTIKIQAAKEFSDDAWYIDQENRHFIKNKGMKIINEGKCEGTIIGGNLCTFNLLQGTQYFPQINGNIILFLEDDGEAESNFMIEFDRNLVSLIQCDFFKHVKGMVIGRAQLNCQMDERKWKKIFDKKELKNIPIVFDADFGHTSPMFIFPIGGNCKMNLSKKNIVIEIK